MTSAQADHPALVTEALEAFAARGIDARVVDGAVTGPTSEEFYSVFAELGFTTADSYGSSRRPKYQDRKVPTIRRRR